MNKSRLLGAARACVFLLTATISAAVSAVTIQIHQEGYSEGAYLTATITANTNGSTIITDEANQITSFLLTFTGNSVVPQFIVNDESNLNNLYIDLDLGTIILGGGGGTRPGPRWFVKSACGGSQNCGAVIQLPSGAWADTTVGGAIITSTSPVPVPAAVWLFGSGLLGLIGMARRKKA